MPEIDSVDPQFQWSGLVIPDRVAQRAAERFTEVLLVAGLGPCHISTNRPTSRGYAQIGWRDPGETQRSVPAHRAAWQHHNGPIPPTMTIDHKCRQIRCVRREHLRLRTWSHNASDNNQKRTRILSDRVCKCGEFKVMSVTRRGDGTPGSKTRYACRSCANTRNRERRRALSANR